MPVAEHGPHMVLIELGAVFVGLALLARLASRLRFSPIPLYLLAGLAFGNGGILPLDLSEGFIKLGAEIGVLLLLFMLGLEYSGHELRRNIRNGYPAGAVDILLNFPPGFLAGLLLGWRPLPSVLLGGVTYISSSGVIAKLLSDLKRMAHSETQGILTVLVLEDLAMAVFLPLMGALLVGGSAARILTSVAISVVAVLTVLLVALRYGARLSRLVAHESDEILLLTTFGTVLLVAGVAQRLQVSAAIGAFLVGIALSGPIASRSHRLLAPLRDLFATTFFFFFGLEVNPSALPTVLPAALGLAVVTALTKVGTGYWTARRSGVDPRGRFRAGVALVARGEFSILIAGLGAAIEPQLIPFSAAYVLTLAVLGPLLARVVR